VVHRTGALQQVPKRFQLSTKQPKTEAIRISLLVWQARNTPPDMTPRKRDSRKSTPRRGGRTLAIARKVIAEEKRKATPLWGITPPEAVGADNEFSTTQFKIEQEVQSKVGRYMRNARKTLSNVSNGTFP